MLQFNRAVGFYVKVRGNKAKEIYDISEKTNIGGKVRIKTWALRRSVRSDAQLSSTETRFQRCSQNGKNGSEHPMLSISMAYNMISCKKVERNTQKLKIADFTM